jgi:hypothetical protein
MKQGDNEDHFKLHVCYCVECTSRKLNQQFSYDHYVTIITNTSFVTYMRYLLVTPSSEMIFTSLENQLLVPYSV